MKSLRIKRVRIYAINWKKWVGIFWQNYDLHSGGTTQWCGFRVYYGFGALCVEW